MRTNRRRWLLFGVLSSLLLLPSCLKTRAGGEAQEIDSMKPIASAGPIELETAPRKISLPTEKALASWLETLGPGQHLYLVLRGLRADEQPGVLYHLYLGPGTDSTRYIGTFNFYDALPIRDEKETAPPSSGFNSYDITELAKALRDRGMLSEPTTVTIQAGGSPVPGSRPVIDKIELVLQ